MKVQTKWVSYASYDAQLHKNSALGTGPPKY